MRLAMRTLPATRSRPISPWFRPSIRPGGSQDAFLVKLNAQATGLLFSTLLGGSGDDGHRLRDRGRQLRQRLRRPAIRTTRRGFPLVPVRSIQAFDRYTEAFVTKFNPAGSALRLFDLPRRQRLRRRAITSRSLPPATPWWLARARRPRSLPRSRVPIRQPTTRPAASPTPSLRCSTRQVPAWFTAHSSATTRTISATLWP